MTNLLEVGNTKELAEGTMKEVLVQGHEILLARVGDSYYAVDNRCPHMGGKLSQGKLAGTTVTCPLHGSQFDLTGGQVVRWLSGGLASKIGRVVKPSKPLNVYKVKVEDSRILIEL
jgi:3-phenylpropionate/trans-cinnamate dioxygenase ferredoxin subunit